MSDVKNKMLKDVDQFKHMCLMMLKTDAANFADTNFPKLINDVWDSAKSDSENVSEVKRMFNLNKIINENVGNPAAAQTIAAFEKGWLNEIK